MFSKKFIIFNNLILFNLQFLKKKVDFIYIDPPYNTGATDWKYNNKFVDTEDSFRHSKWLNMMYIRLKIAKELITDEERNKTIENLKNVGLNVKLSPSNLRPGNSNECCEHLYYHLSAFKEGRIIKISKFRFIDL